MSNSDNSEKISAEQIVIEVQPDGPYKVSGPLSLRNYSVIESDAGESLEWKPGDEVDAKRVTMLCRCGHSANKPFCDGSHADKGFDGTETADTGGYADRAKSIGGGKSITIVDDRSICEHAGFCGNEQSDIWKMAESSPNGADEALMAAMVNRCPSGALTYRVDGESIEQTSSQEIRLVENGPLWVTGAIPISRADGAAFETRNRVTLCCCGKSGNKPLCDGSHKDD